MDPAPSRKLKDALVNPSKVFKTPTEVLLQQDFTREQKIEILRQWEVDARLLATAEHENMTDGEPSRLGAVVQALLTLDDEEKLQHSEAPSPPKPH